MSEIGPVSLDEARDVIADRLLLLEIDPPKSRYGRVFVGSPHQARGRTFRVVFVAGPRRADVPAAAARRSDAARSRDARAARRRARRCRRIARAAERLLLRLAVGARDRAAVAVVSADRDRRVASARAVASTRSTSCARSPAASRITRSCRRARGVRRGRRARLAGAGAAGRRDRRSRARPLRPARSCSQVEPRASVRGHAHYLLRLNETLKRSVTARWARGAIAVDAVRRHHARDRHDEADAGVAAARRPRRIRCRRCRSSPRARTSSCSPRSTASSRRRSIEPLQKLDPLTRGSIFHEVAGASSSARCKADGRLPVPRAGRRRGARDARPRHRGGRGQVSTSDLAPAIDRVWRDEIADISRDLRVWVRRLPAGRRLGCRRYFEFALRPAEGLTRTARSRAASPDPVLVDGRFKLRGSVDLIERAASGTARCCASPITRPARTGRRGRR